LALYSGNLGQSPSQLANTVEVWGSAVVEIEVDTVVVVVTVVVVDVVVVVEGALVVVVVVELVVVESSLPSLSSGS